MAVIQKYAKSEKTWQNSEDEIVVLQSQLSTSKQSVEELAAKLIALESEYNTISEQCQQYAEKQEQHNAVTQNLYGQLAQQVRECQAEKDRSEGAQKENEELKNRLQLIENLNASELIIAEQDSDSDSNKNNTMWNKPAIMHWLSNSELKNLKESEDIINAMCNVSVIAMWRLSGI